MKMMKRFAALALALVLTMSLAACGGGEMSEGSRTDGIFYEATGVCGDAVLMRVGGVDVTAESYFYQLYNMLSNIAMYCGADGFEQDSGDGRTYADVCREYTMQSVKEIAMVEPLAKENGLALTEDDLAKIAEEINAYEEQYGEFGFQYMGVTRETMEYMYRAFGWYDLLEQSVYVEGGALAPTDEEILAYAEEQGLLKADHILLGNTNPITGEALSAEQVAAQLQTANDLLAQLQAAEDVEALFAELADAYSEDPGRAYYPEGYVFGPGEMVPEFENAAKELTPGSISGVVESSYGYHILLRKGLTADDVLAGSDYFSGVLKKHTETAEVEYSALYNENVAALDLGAFYTAVTKARDALYTDYMAQQEANGETGEGENTEEAVG